MKKNILLLLALLVVGVSSAMAQVPVTLNFQGKLVDKNDKAVTSSVDVTFEIFDVATGGYPLHTEEINVTPDQGYFNVIIGANPSNPIKGLTGTKTLWYQISFNGTTLPRKQFDAVPYALGANDALDAKHAEYADSADTAKWAQPMGPAGGVLAGEYPNPSFDDAKFAEAMSKNFDDDMIIGKLQGIPVNGDVTGWLTNNILIKENAVKTIHLYNGAVTLPKIAKPEDITKNQLIWWNAANGQEYKWEYAGIGKVVGLNLTNDMVPVWDAANDKFVDSYIMNDRVNSLVSISESVNIAKALNVTGNTDIGGNLSVIGTSLFGGKAGYDGTIILDPVNYMPDGFGPRDFATVGYVDNILATNFIVDANYMPVSDPTGMFYVNSPIMLNGHYETTLPGDPWTVDSMTVGEHLNLAKSLFVTGMTTLNDAAALNSTLDVAGATTIDNTLDVTGVASYMNVTATANAEGNLWTPDGATQKSFASMGYVQDLTRGINAISPWYYPVMNDVGMYEDGKIRQQGNNVIVRGDFNVSDAATDTRHFTVENVDGAANYVTVDATSMPYPWMPASAYEQTLATKGYTDWAINTNIVADDTYLTMVQEDASGNKTLVNSPVKTDNSITPTNVTIALPTALASTLDVADATALASTLDVAGATTLASTLDVADATALASTLDVAGATALASTLDVAGATALASTLDVTGATTLASTLDVAGATVIDNTLNVTNDVTFDTKADYPNVVAPDYMPTGSTETTLATKGYVDYTTTNGVDNLYIPVMDKDGINTPKYVNSPLHVDDVNAPTLVTVDATTQIKTNTLIGTDGISYTNPVDGNKAYLGTAAGYTGLAAQGTANSAIMTNDMLALGNADLTALNFTVDGATGYATSISGYAVKNTATTHEVIKLGTDGTSNALVVQNNTPTAEIVAVIGTQDGTTGVLAIGNGVDPTFNVAGTNGAATYPTTDLTNPVGILQYMPIGWDPATDLQTLITKGYADEAMKLTIAADEDYLTMVALDPLAPGGKKLVNSPVNLIDHANPGVGVQVAGNVRAIGTDPLAPGTGYGFQGQYLDAYKGNSYNPADYRAFFGINGTDDFGKWTLRSGGSADVNATVAARGDKGIFLGTNVVAPGVAATDATTMLALGTNGDVTAKGVLTLGNAALPIANTHVVRGATQINANAAGDGNTFIGNTGNEVTMVGTDVKINQVTGMNTHIGTNGSITHINGALNINTTDHLLTTIGGQVTMDQGGMIFNNTPGNNFEFHTAGVPNTVPAPYYVGLGGTVADITAAGIPVPDATYQKFIPRYTNIGNYDPMVFASVGFVKLAVKEAAAIVQDTYIPVSNAGTSYVPSILKRAGNANVTLDPNDNALIIASTTQAGDALTTDRLLTVQGQVTANNFSAENGVKKSAIGIAGNGAGAPYLSLTNGTNAIATDISATQAGFAFGNAAGTAGGAIIGSLNNAGAQVGAVAIGTNMNGIATPAINTAFAVNGIADGATQGGGAGATGATYPYVNNAAYVNATTTPAATYMPTNATVQTLATMGYVQGMNMNLAGISARTIPVKNTANTNYINSPITIDADAATQVLIGGGGPGVDLRAASINTTAAQITNMGNATGNMNITGATTGISAATALTFAGQTIQANSANTTTLISTNATTITGVPVNINTTAANATNIGMAGSTNTVLGTTNINATGANNTTIGAATNNVNIFGATNTITGTTNNISGTTNVNAGAVGTTNIGTFAGAGTINIGNIAGSTTTLAGTVNADNNTTGIQYTNAGVIAPNYMPAGATNVTLATRGYVDAQTLGINAVAANTIPIKNNANTAFINSPLTMSAGGAAPLNSSASLNVTGTVTASAGFTATTGGLNVIAGGITSVGNTLINDNAGAATTNIGTGGTTGAVNIGNANNVTVAGTIVALNGAANNITGTNTINGPTNINNNNNQPTNIGTGTTTSPVNIGGTANSTVITGGTASINVGGTMPNGININSVGAMTMKAGTVVDGVAGTVNLADGSLFTINPGVAAATYTALGVPANGQVIYIFNADAVNSVTFGTGTINANTLQGFVFVSGAWHAM